MREDAGYPAPFLGVRCFDGEHVFLRRLTFDLSGWPKASPLEGRVSPQLIASRNADELPEPQRLLIG